MNLREVRKELRAYFGEVENRICFVRVRGRVIIDIEYVDFRSEQVVESDVRRIVGSSFLLNVKRECSAYLISEIRDFIASDKSGENTFRMILSNYTSRNIASGSY